jgi:hypothetical protein
MTKTTEFRVYVQALGGKFLGPNAYKKEEIKLTLNTVNENYKLPYYEKGMDDGEILPDFIDGESSFMPIITPQPLNAQMPATVHYLTPGKDTVVASHPIELTNDIETAHLIVDVPSPNGWLQFVQPVLLGNDISTSKIKNPITYRTTVVVPGLLVWQPVLFENYISIVVTMMCGCKVSNLVNTTFWESSDFEVYAYVEHYDQGKSVLRLDFNAHSPDSRFEGKIPMSGIKSIFFAARQISTGNYGFFSYTL